MKTTVSIRMALFVKGLFLAGLLAAWILTAPVSARDNNSANVPDAEEEDDFRVSPRQADPPRAGKERGQTGAGIPTRLSEMFVAGGPLMWPIALCSVIVVAFSVERLVVLRRRRVIPKDFVKRFLEHLENGQLD